MKSMRFGVRVVGVLAFLLVSGWLAQRQARAMQLTSQQKQEMRLHYDRATRAFDVGKYQEAIEEYQKAYEIGGDPAMLYNIAQAYRLNDQPADALRFYRRYLQRQPNAHNREYVDRKIADLEKLIEERRKAAAAAPPFVPAPQPSPVVVTPVVPATPPSPPPLLMEPPPEPKPLPPAEPPPSRRGLKIAGWSALGAAVVTGGLAAYFGEVAKSKADKISSESRMGISFEPGVAAVEQNGKNANLAAIVLGSASGACLVTGAILLIVGRTPSQPAEAPSTQTARATLSPWVSVAGGFVGAGAHLRF